MNLTLSIFMFFEFWQTYSRGVAMYLLHKRRNNREFLSLYLKMFLIFQLITFLTVWQSWVNLHNCVPFMTQNVRFTRFISISKSEISIFYKLVRVHVKFVVVESTILWVIFNKFYFMKYPLSLECNNVLIWVLRISTFIWKMYI